MPSYNLHPCFFFLLDPRLISVKKRGTSRNLEIMPEFCLLATFQVCVPFSLVLEPESSCSTKLLLSVNLSLPDFPVKIKHRLPLDLASSIQFKHRDTWKANQVICVCFLLCVLNRGSWFCTQLPDDSSGASWARREISHLESQVLILSVST